MVSSLETRRKLDGIKSADNKVGILTKGGIVPVELAHKDDMGYESVCVIIDAKSARELLGSNTHKNRKISNATVTKYSEDMKNGEWLSSACEPITISSDGELINGQHRLTAIIKADVAVPTEIRLGVDGIAYNFFDQGKKRSFDDGLDVEKNGRTIAGFCSYALSVAYYGGFNGFAKASKQNGKVTKSGVINMYNSIENARPGLLVECARVAKRTNSYGWSPQAIGVGLLAMHLANSDVAEKFCEDLFLPMPLNESFYSFRTYAMNGKTKTYKDAVRKHLTVYALAKCWNTYFGARPTKIRYSEKSIVDIIGFNIEMFRQFAPQTREEQ